MQSPTLISCGRVRFQLQRAHEGVGDHGDEHNLITTGRREESLEEWSNKKKRRRPMTLRRTSE